MPFNYEDDLPRLNKDGKPTDYNNFTWDEFLAGTRKWPNDVKGPLFEVFPDHDYRYRRGGKPLLAVPRPGGGDISDLRFLKALKSHLPDNGEIYPSGLLLDMCIKYSLGKSNKRPPYHQRLRRLWRKGYIRMFKRVWYDACGRWYKLEEQEGWFVNGARVNKFDRMIGRMIGRMIE